MGNHLAETMGVQTEYVDSTWGTIIAALKADKCDIAMVGLFRLAQRAEVILFSNPWGFNTMIVVAREGKNFASMDEVNSEDVTLASISGTAEEEAMKRYFPKAQVRSVVTDKLASVFLELAAGRADAMLIETTTARLFIGENPEMKNPRPRLRSGQSAGLRVRDGAGGIPLPAVHQRLDGAYRDERPEGEDLEEVERPRLDSRSGLRAGRFRRDSKPT